MEAVSFIDAASFFVFVFQLRHFFSLKPVFIDVRFFVEDYFLSTSLFDSCFYRPHFSSKPISLFADAFYSSLTVDS